MGIDGFFPGFCPIQESRDSIVEGELSDSGYVEISFFRRPIM